MVLISLKKDRDALERAQQAIARGESFVVVVQGLSAHSAKKIKPVFDYLSIHKRQKFGLLERLKYAFYALFIGALVEIDYFARKAGMRPTWEEHTESLIVTFRPKHLEEENGEEFHHR